MSPCKNFRDLILTDYIDGEIEQKIKVQLEEHLRTCSSCREFADEAKTRLVAPFQKAAPDPVPQDLWSAIETEILQQQENTSRNWLARLTQVFTLPRLVPVVLSLVLFISAGMWMLYERQIVKINNEQEEYAAYVWDSVELSEADNGLDTPLEQYFL